MEPLKYQWRTPPQIIATMKREFGRFALDACASEGNAVCSRFITREQNCLTTDWGLVSYEIAWMNPPYGAPQGDFPGTGAFVDRAYEQTRQCGLAIVLVESATDTAWWRRAFMRASLIRILPRVKFLHPVTGEPGESPRMGSTLFVFSGRSWPMAPRVSLGDINGGKL